MSDRQQARPDDSNTPGMASAAESQAMIQNAVQSPHVPRLYANGVGLGMSGGDAIIVLFANGTPVGILNMPFVTVRGMADDLTTMLKDLEAAMGSRIPGPKELAEGMARVNRARVASETLVTDTPRAGGAVE